VKKTLKWRLDLWWILFSYAMKLKGRFRIAAILSLVSAVFSACIYFFVSKVVVGGTNSLIGGYGSGDYFAYVLAGMMITAVVSVGLTMTLSTMRELFWANKLEAMLMTKMGVGTYLASAMILSFIYASLNILLFLGIGVAIFGTSFHVGQGGLLVVLIILLSSFAVSGIGLMATGAFVFMGAKLGSEPVTWIFLTLQGFVAGIYFPPTLLPPPVNYLSGLIPQSFGVEALRQVLLNGRGLTDQAVLLPVLSLFAYCLISFPVGLMTFKAAMRRVESRGSLGRWV